MIRKCLKIELYRLWHNAYIYLAILSGCIISVIHIITIVYPRSLYLVPFINLEYPYSIFNTCLAMDYTSVYPVIFLYVIPLMIVFPFGASYYQDLRTGYIRQVYMRTDRRSWLLAKYVTVFFSGAVIYVIPLVFDTILTAGFIPALLPQRAIAMYGVFSGSFLNEFFYTRPWTYYVIFLFIGMVYAGSLACLALAVTPIFHSSFFVLMTPVFFVFVTNAVFDLFHIGVFQILRNMSPIGMCNVINGGACIGEMVLLLAVSFCVFMKGGKRLDVY